MGIKLTQSHKSLSTITDGDTSIGEKMGNTVSPEEAKVHVAQQELEEIISVMERQMPDCCNCQRLGWNVQ
jgi:hypothetical protein